ncbi:MAG: molybdenum cofactor guanylyltransferase [Chloroflexota bacterium]
MRISAIVLAGGRSSRFGGPKLQVLVDGIPLLDRALRATAEVANEVIVVGPAGGDVGLTDLDGLPSGVRVEVVLDPEEGGGPLVGLRTGLDAATGERAIVVGGDMPRLEPAVLRALLDRLDRPSAAGLGSPDAVVLGQRGGGRPLPVALRHADARRAIAEAVAAGETALHAALARLTMVELPEEEWRALDPAGGSLLDVDTPADLDAAH